MLAFYIDHQFHAGVTRGLRQRNVDVLTALEDGTDKLADQLLLARATELQRIVVTHDKGFLRLAREWQASGREFAGIAFAVQMRLNVGKAVEYLESMAHSMTADEMRNHVEYIPTT